MILNYIIIPFIKLIPVGIYLFFFFRRMFGFFGLKKDRKLTRIISIIIPATMVLYGINKWGFGHVLITHLTFFAVLFEIINIIVVHVLKKKSDKWKKIYSSGLIPILCLAVILGYGMYNMFNIVETDYTIYTDKNIRDEGYRVALISDLHYGTTIDGDRLTEICEDISERNVDIVALAGDIVDESTTEKEMKEAAEILGNIKSKYGIFYVFGNHDKNTYVRKQLYTVNELITTLENNEIQVLIDDAVEINDDMVVIGRDDGDNPESDQRASTSEIIKDIEKDKFLLMKIISLLAYKKMQRKK